jgi:hypothetical protein
MDKPVVLADLTLIRKSVRLPEEGTPESLTFETPEGLDAASIVGSIFSLHRTSPNTYDVVLALSTIPPDVVEAADQARADQRAEAFESLDIPPSE